jgi:hypothetical protein
MDEAVALVVEETARGGSTWMNAGAAYKFFLKKIHLFFFFFQKCYNPLAQPPYFLTQPPHFLAQPLQKFTAHSPAQKKKKKKN